MADSLKFKEISASIESKLSRYFGVSPEEASNAQMYKAVILTVRDALTSKRSVFRHTVKKEKKKRVYYLCMEFLIGKSLRNNLMNLGIDNEYREVLKSMGFDLDELYDIERDPGLGNDYPATGFSLCYEYGLFKQKIVDGSQVEMPDVWMPSGESWLVPRNDKTFTVRFGGKVSERWENNHLNIIHTDYEEVQAVPYDMMISGRDSFAVNNLRLWRAHDMTNFNMNLFTQGQYMQAVQENTNAETLTKLLYPSDEHMEGKILRLSQQYFLVSASLQNIVADHLSVYGTLSNFAEKNSIHINDTHPALCIPELMRIFMDVYSFSWESAWSVVTKTVSYTNHTVLPEALECWNEDIFRLRLPRIYGIVCEINRRFCADLWNMYPGDWDRISRMSIMANGQVRMANLSVLGSHKTNGVSALHSEILKKTVFHDFYTAFPERFTNVTNGIAHRRWLCYSNPELAGLLNSTIGDGYIKNPEELSKFADFYNDSSVIDALRGIKHRNKERFAEYYRKTTGLNIDTHSVFDVQVKRMHEYKRQLLNVLKIVSYYNDLLENPDADVTPKTFLFGGKAAPSYYFAKDIIKLIWALGNEIDKNPKIREKLRVIYLEDYNVSTAEILMPATDISEQISLAGKEASGTGCMKFMINGALTLGTLDGANVEMAEAVGNDNIYIFGLTSAEVDDLWRRGYSSMLYYKADPKLKAAVDRIAEGFAGEDFTGIVNYFLANNKIPDPYMCLADFESYVKASDRIMLDYSNRNEWTKRSLLNIAAAGKFSSDRSIKEYADNIWGIEQVKE